MCEPVNAWGYTELNSNKDWLELPKRFFPYKANKRIFLDLFKGHSKTPIIMVATLVNLAHARMHVREIESWALHFRACCPLKNRRWVCNRERTSLVISLVCTAKSPEVHMFNCTRLFLHLNFQYVKL